MDMVNERPGCANATGVHQADLRPGAPDRAAPADGRGARGGV